MKIYQDGFLYYFNFWYYYVKIIKKYLKTHIFLPKITLLKTIDIYFRGETFKGKSPLNE
jgi:hypothetical protein